jgi:hypothetical protein
VTISSWWYAWMPSVAKRSVAARTVNPAMIQKTRERTRAHSRIAS